MTQQTTFARCTGVRHLLSVPLVALIFSASLLSSVRVEAGNSDLDPSFNGGIVITNQNEFEQINDLAIQPDGKIVAVGRSGISHESELPHLDMMVARYNTDGSLDTTFGNGGIVTTRVLRDDTAMAVALQQDGKIVIAGTAGFGNFSSLALLRYNTHGSLDTTFGFDGIVDNRIVRLSRSKIMDLAIQSDGKIVVAGEANISGRLDNITATLVRLETDGFPDVTFGDRGVSHPVPAGFVVSPMVSFKSMALQPDEKIVVAGDCADFTFVRFCLSRYNADGSLDNTFNGNGLVMIDVVFSNEVAKAVSLQPDGKIVAAWQSGSPFFGGYVPVLARFNTDGSLDASFNFGQVKIFDQFRVESLALKPNGKIVIVGESFFDSSHSAIRVAYCSSEGVIEETMTIPIGQQATANAVAVQPDGGVVVGGYGNFFTHSGATFSDLVLMRFEPNHAPVVTITDPSSGSVFAVNTPIHFAGTFTDDEGDTHTAEWTFESITKPAEVFEPFGLAQRVAQTTHTFSEAGVYKVSLKVTDNEFLSGTSTTVNDLDAFVVIYDPNGGFVAGGGWIASPVGAYSLMPESTGKANFGFVSKYQNGASAPTGNVEFQFNAAGLKFQSKSFEWLVISGGRKAQYKGAGTINGGGSYHFMLTAIDGDQTGGYGQDKFRIRIWSDNDGLIYDNQLNAPDGDDPTTVLGGGSIVIHH